MAKPDFKLSYAATIPFSARTSVILYTFYAVAAAGLLVWNFLSQAKGLQCLSYASGEYNNATCEPARLEFGRSYYTRSTSSVAPGTIGTFPWQPYGFGNGTNNAPLDYTILTVNWTADPLSCVMYEQFLILDLSTENSVANACYYCGSALRVICATMDAQRMQIPDMSAVSYVQVLDSFNRLSVLAHGVATSAVDGATVGSVRIKRKRVIPSLPAGIVPVTNDEFSITLGSTIGSFPIDSSNSNTAVAGVASFAQTLSQVVEEAMERDLQPGDDSQPARTLQASYLCKHCEKRYKPALEIIALLLSGTAALLAPLMTAAKLVAEWMAPAPSRPDDNAQAPDFGYKPTPSALPTPSLQQTAYPTYPAPYPAQNPPMQSLNYQQGPYHA